MNIRAELVPERADIDGVIDDSEGDCGRMRAEAGCHTVDGLGGPRA